MTATVFMTGSQALERIAAIEAGKAAAQAAQDAKAEAERKARARKAKLREAERKRRAARRDVLFVSSYSQSTFMAFFGEFCRVVHLTKDEVTSPDRTMRITATRQVLCWIGIRRFGRSYPYVCGLFDRDHTTIMHAVRKIDALIAEHGLTVPDNPMGAALYLNRELGGVQ